MRIVSLIASATEMVAALGFTDQLVGISHECDYPPEAVEGRIVVTSPKLDVTRSSLAIHQDVQKIVEKGLAVYNIDVEKLKKLSPDLIITQDQCDVCAVTYEEVVQATQQCLDGEARIVTLHPDSLEDVFADILKVGRALDVPEKGKELVETMKEKMEWVVHQTEKQKKKPKVVCMEWLQPLMVAGNWIPELVAMAGGIPGLIQEGEHTKVVAWKEIEAFDPDLLLVFPCGYKIEQTFKNRSDVEDLPGWLQLRAVREKKVYVIDGNSYMNRPGPRILESLYILAGLLHPKLFRDHIPEDAVQRWE